MQAPSWDQTWQAITTSPPWQWQFTTWLALLDHWQTLVAGVLALGAASIAVRAARQKERREVEAIRLSLAVEIRRLVNVLLEAHKGFGEAFSLASSTNRRPRGDDVVKIISQCAPVVFPAMADRVGLLGSRVAPYVLTFYSNLKGIEHVGRMVASNPAEPVPPDSLRALMKRIEDACRQNVLPLLSKLPRDKADPDTERKAKIEAMG
jgi:hypothetical protein